MVRSEITNRNRIIVALDFSTIGEARDLVNTLDDAATFYKIGHQLAFAGGLDLVSELKASGKNVFLDLKLLDIDNTIRGGVTSVAALGADMLTIHAYPKAMSAAVGAKAGLEKAKGLSLLGVTVLTSMDDADLHDAGYAGTATDLVTRRAEQAQQTGMDGLVCSPLKVARLRTQIGGELTFVVPGIRPAGSDHGDQKRVLTPSQALQAGADYLVIGRPINAARDPQQAINKIVLEMDGVN